MGQRCSCYMLPKTKHQSKPNPSSSIYYFSKHKSLQYISTISMALTQNPQLGLFLFTIFTLTITSNSITTNNPPTVYELLPKFGLPSGLLPDNVQSYSLSDDGNFVVELEKPCYIDFDYTVYYDKKITGKLKYGSITNLDGIQVKKFFLWLGVDEIKVDLPPSDNIYFQVGLINKKLDVGQFETVHSCGDKVTGSLAQSWKSVLKLPTPVEEIEMLITE